jgi:hypothetical protein
MFHPYLRPPPRGRTSPGKEFGIVPLTLLTNRCQRGRDACQADASVMSAFRRCRFPVRTSASSPPGEERSEVHDTQTIQTGQLRGKVSPSGSAERFCCEHRYYRLGVEFWVNNSGSVYKCSLWRIICGSGVGESRRLAGDRRGWIPCLYVVGKMLSGASHETVFLPGGGGRGGLWLDGLRGTSGATRRYSRSERSHLLSAPADAQADAARRV